MKKVRKGNEKIEEVFFLRFLMIVVLTVLLVLLIGLSILGFRYAFRDAEQMNSEKSDLLRYELAHYKWWNSLSTSIYFDSEFTGQMDETKCDFGKYLYGDDVKDNASMRDFYERVEPIHREIHQLAADVLQANETDKEQAIALLHDSVEVRIHSLVEILDEMIQIRDEKIKAQEEMVLSMLVAVFVICFLAAAVTIWFINRTYRYVKRSVIIPIIDLQHECEELAKGNLNLNFNVGVNNQIGILAQSLSFAVSEIKKYIDAIDYGMKEFSSGNFTCECPIEFIGDFADIQHSIEEFQNKMNDTLCEMGVAIEQVSAGAEEMAAGAQDIAQGATKQSGSIQDLSLVISNITNQINNNAGYAETADKWGVKTGETVQESKMRMEELVRSIQDIADASEGIKNIINTIDAIASETNLLALNAAIESARAGAAGKGFAVVADEIRKLAQESAEAAQNTTQLIEESLSHIERGKILTDAASNVFQEVSENTDVFLEMIDKIAEESKGQAEAAEQIITGVDSISRVVQTNAAISEESAAASEELSAQAMMMTDLISRFKLNRQR